MMLAVCALLIALLSGCLYLPANLKKIKILNNKKRNKILLMFEKREVLNLNTLLVCGKMDEQVGQSLSCASNIRRPLSICYGFFFVQNRCLNLIKQMLFRFVVVV